MSDARAHSISTHRGFIHQRLGIGLALVVATAGTVAAAYLLTADIDAHDRTAAAASAQAQAVTDASASAQRTEIADIATADGLQTNGAASAQDSRTTPQGPAADSGQQSTARANTAAAPVGADAQAAAEEQEIEEQRLYEAAVADSAEQEASAAAAQAAPGSEPVLHITNVGDKIIASYDQNVIETWTAQQPAAEQSTAQAPATDAPDAGDESDAEQDGHPLPDSTEVYPGCPRALPAGTDKLMVQQMGELYGCKYLSSCISPTDEVPDAICTWHLVGKISS